MVEAGPPGGGGQGVTTSGDRRVSEVRGGSGGEGQEGTKKQRGHQVTSDQSPSPRCQGG